MRVLIWTGLLLALSSCSSPPKPPTVDAGARRPANAAEALELLACQSQLQDARLAAREATQQARSARDTAIALAARQRILAAESARLAPRPNTVYPVLFGFGDSHVALSAGESDRLVAAAHGAALVLLSGRTDGSTDSLAEGRVARQRAEAMRDWLIERGVDPARIRTTWQPVGDAAAEGDSESGRRRNRRVEVQLYSLAPRTVSLDADAVGDAIGPADQAPTGDAP